MRQLDAKSLALVNVSHERLAVTVLGRALAHVLKARLVVHGRIDFLVTGIEDLGSEAIAQPARSEGTRTTL